MRSCVPHALSVRLVTVDASSRIETLQVVFVGHVEVPANHIYLKRVSCKAANTEAAAEDQLYLWGLDDGHELKNAAPKLRDMSTQGSQSQPLVAVRAKDILDQLQAYVSLCFHVAKEGQSGFPKGYYACLAALP